MSPEQAWAIIDDDSRWASNEPMVLNGERLSEFAPYLDYMMSRIQEIEERDGNQNRT